LVFLVFFFFLSCIPCNFVKCWMFKFFFFAISDTALASFVLGFRSHHVPDIQASGHMSKHTFGQFVQLSCFGKLWSFWSGPQSWIWVQGCMQWDPENRSASPGDSLLIRYYRGQTEILVLVHWCMAYATLSLAFEQSRSGSGWARTFCGCDGTKYVSDLIVTTNYSSRVADQNFGEVQCNYSVCLAVGGGIESIWLQQRYCIIRLGSGYLLTDSDLRCVVLSYMRGNAKTPRIHPLFTHHLETFWDWKRRHNFMHQLLVWAVTPRKKTGHHHRKD
jgi:hypothetical protein